MDLLIAAVPSLLFGTVSLVIVRIGGDNRQQTVGQLGGGFLFALVATAVIRPTWTAQDLVVSFLSGVLVGVGIQWLLKSFRSIGVSRTMPVSTGAQLLGISLGGVVLFGEWRHGASLPVGLAALALIILGITLTAWSGGGGDCPGVDWRRGRIELAVSSVGLIAYVLLIRWFDIDGLTALLPQAAGYFATALLLTSPRLSPELGPVDTRWTSTTLKQVLPGMMWGSAVLLMQVSAARVGVAAGFTLSQLGVVISTLGGIWLLGETRPAHELVRLLAGCALVLLGAVLIGLAKGLDVA